VGCTLGGLSPGNCNFKDILTQALGSNLTARWVTLLATLVQLAVVTVLSAAGAPIIDSDVRALVGEGRARVLVELRVDDPAHPGGRDHAIARAQDAVLARLPVSHASVVRRYASIPMLALEIDATALRALGAMTDVVVRVRADSTARPQ
jgi:hypothetical protein